ncbi:hypothetical protein TNCV_3161401 [Trichonephila clavipes]|nr:hypothetical protein TNCV_3161401 [Trichonephila clavipes]
MKLSLLTSHASVCNTTMVGFESGDSEDWNIYLSTDPAWRMPSFFSSIVSPKRREKRWKTPQPANRPWQAETGWGEETRSVSKF